MLAETLEIGTIQQESCMFQAQPLESDTRGTEHTHPPLLRANRFLVGEGISVPVEETEDVEEPSSSWCSSGMRVGSYMGTSDGSLASLALAKDFWSSLMRCP